MHHQIAQAEIAYSFDTGILVLAVIFALGCGGTFAMRLRRPIGAIACGVLSLLLAAWIVLSRRYDPEFVRFSAFLLIGCSGCFIVSGVWQLGRHAGHEV